MMLVQPARRRVDDDEWSRALAVGHGPSFTAACISTAHTALPHLTVGLSPCGSSFACIIMRFACRGAPLTTPRPAAADASPVAAHHHVVVSLCSARRQTR